MAQNGVHSKCILDCNVAKILCLPVEIMLASLSFVKQMFELNDLSFLCFVMSMFFYFVYK